MARSHIDLDMNIDPVLPKKRDWGIGCIGSGFIMRDVQIPAYLDAGFKPVAIASRTPAHARETAEARNIPKVYDTWQELLEDEEGSDANDSKSETCPKEFLPRTKGHAPIVLPVQGYPLAAAAAPP